MRDFSSNHLFFNLDSDWFLHSRDFQTATEAIATDLDPSPRLLVKCLTSTKLQAKHDRGLCYNFDEKNHPKYCCKIKFYLLLGTNDDETIKPSPVPLDDDTEILGDVSSLHSLIGHLNLHTLPLFGRVEGFHQVHILIDDGATHNGQKLMSQWRCPSMAITIQGYSFSLDLYVLPMEGPYIVLGVQWLLEFSVVRHNYKTQTLI